MESKYKKLDIYGMICYINNDIYKTYETNINVAIKNKDLFKIQSLSEFVINKCSVIGQLVKQRYDMEFILDNFQHPQIQLNFLNKEYDMITACKAKEIVEQKTEQYLQEVVLPQYIKLANELVNKVIESNPFYYQASLDIPSVDYRFIKQIASKIEEYGYTCVTYSSDGFADAYIKIEWK
jgi:hypothetical protein